MNPSLLATLSIFLAVLLIQFVCIAALIIFILYLRDRCTNSSQVENDDIELPRVESVYTVSSDFEFIKNNLKSILEPFICRDSSNCAICLEMIKIGQSKLGNQAMRLPCTHFFHQNCLLEWLRRRPVCPLCNKDLGIMILESESQKN